MKIAFVDHPWSTVLPPVQAGSISIWTWEVARRVARQHQVLVYEGGGPAFGQDRHSCQNVEYRRLWVKPDALAMKLIDRLVWRGYLKNTPAALDVYYAWYAFCVARDIARERCDVVHIHQFSQFAPIIRRFNPRAKIVIHMNCEWLTQFDRSLIAPRLRAADLILGCSDHITRLVTSEFPEFASRCRTVYNGVDTDKFVPETAESAARRDRSGPKRLVYVGRVSPEKGIHDLLDAFALVIAQHPGVELEIIGPEWVVPVEWLVGLSKDPLVAQLKTHYEGGDYGANLRKRIPKQIEDKVKFTGLVPNDQLVSRYHAADVLINPSLSESFGMTVAEANACAKPVIVTRVGGMTETVVQGKNGLAVPPADKKALSEAILYMLENEPLWDFMGRFGRQRTLDLYSWDRVAEQLLQSYQGIPSNASAVH